MWVASNHPVSPSRTTTSYAYKHGVMGIGAGGGGGDGDGDGGGVVASPRAKANVFERLTDVRGYTGAHRQRFDVESGRGMGVKGSR